MTKGILVVESAPASPDVAVAYREWYQGTHIPEMLAIEGFASARRFESLDGHSLVVIYETDADIETAKANLKVAQTGGTLSKPVGMRLDPPPSVRWFRATGSD